MIKFDLAPVLFQTLSPLQEGHRRLVVVKCLTCGDKVLYQEAILHAAADHHRTKIKLIPRKKVAA